MNLYRVYFERKAAESGAPLTTIVRAATRRAARMSAESSFSATCGKVTKVELI